jgi:hypothetical protein
MKRLLRDFESSARGRPAQCEPTAEDLQKLRAVYVRTNRATDAGSKVAAARILARSGELSEPVAAAILKPRASKALPKCVRDQMTVPIDIIRHHRSPKDARLSGFYIPGSLRMVNDADGLRRLYAGERQSWDDATINFGVVVPWPWGGCKCSDRYGVKLGRFQLLACIDDAYDFCPGYTYTIREQQSYRAEDTVAAQYRLWRDVYMPARAMLEGGAWQSNRAHEFYRAAGLEVEDATGRPHSKLIESWFNRLWTPLSLLPGNVGRWRGEMERENELYLKCRQGRADPREHFPLLDQALDDLHMGVSGLNAEVVESKKYGRWVPQEAHEESLKQHPRPRLDASLGFMAAPIREKRTVRRNMVQVTCPGPFGGSFPYHFADESLWEFEGCETIVYFDPYDSPLRASIILNQDYKGLAKGHIITTCALCLDDAPEVMRALDGLSVEVNADATRRAIEMRKRIHGAIRREYRALGFGGVRVAAASEVRGEGQKTVVEISKNAPDGGLHHSDRIGGVSLAAAGRDTDMNAVAGPGVRKAQAVSHSPVPPARRSLPVIKTRMQLLDEVEA